MFIEWEFIDGLVIDFVVIDDGWLLVWIYSESDLLVVECLCIGVWEGLKLVELVGVVLVVVYEMCGGDG